MAFCSAFPCWFACLSDGFSCGGVNVFVLRQSRLIFSTSNSFGVRLRVLVYSRDRFNCCAGADLVRDCACQVSLLTLSSSRVNHSGLLELLTQIPNHISVIWFVATSRASCFVHKYISTDRCFVFRKLYPNILHDTSTCIRRNYLGAS
jgi:hypothetical protein